MNGTISDKIRIMNKRKVVSQLVFIKLDNDLHHIFLTAKYYVSKVLNNQNPFAARYITNETLIDSFNFQMSEFKTLDRNDINLIVDYIKDFMEFTDNKNKIVCKEILKHINN